MTTNTINDAVTMAGGGETLLAGRYRVVRQLGQGGMGSVWLAEDTQLDGKLFAIKMLPSILVSNKRAYRQLKDEALVAMQLVHPNIVQIRAFEENNGNPFLVMDYVDGETLDDYLAEKGKLSEDETISLLKPIAAALDYAHGEGVVHRDVKPANIMIRKDGHPFILDFGISREIQETMTRVTGKLSSGTLLYMSPEQLNGEAPRPAQDVYSFSAMVYECLKGEPPFVRGAIEDQIKNKVPELPVGASASLASSVMAGLAKKPEDRPPNCAAVVEVGGFKRRNEDGQRGKVAGRDDTIATETQGTYLLRSEESHTQTQADCARLMADARVAKSRVARFADDPDCTDEIREIDDDFIRADAFLAEKQWSLAAGYYARIIERAGAMEEFIACREANLRPSKMPEAQGKTEGQDSSNVLREECSAAEPPLGGVAGKSARAPWMFVFLVMLAAVNFYIWRMNILDAWPGWSGQDMPASHGGVSSRARLEGTRVEKLDTFAKAEATEIRSEALSLKSMVEEISDVDGFLTRKCALADMFARADELFDEQTRQWDEAAQMFTNYVNECRLLIVLDGERRTASRNRQLAQDAFVLGEASEAKIYAMDSWNAAVSEWNSAADAFGRMDFTMAATGFEVAQEGFLRAGCEARNKKRKEEEKRTGMRRSGGVNDDLDALLSDLEADTRKTHGVSTRERWRREGEQFTINEPNGLNMTMKWCPNGSFTMGSPTTEVGRLYWQENNSSDRMDMEFQHQVILTKGFWMGETEVTQGQWKKVMSGETVVDLARKGLQDDTLYQLDGKKQTFRDLWEMTKHGNPQNRCGDLKDNVPVYYVSWDEAVEFCRRLTAKERAEGRMPDGYEYRLPTEAEWEYACRAGTTTALPNGKDLRILGRNNAPALDDIAWYGGNSSVGFDGRGWDTSNWPEKQYSGGRAAPREVKGKQANNWGLYDMIGNVREWCVDWASAYKHNTVIDPMVGGSGVCRIYRGGSWNINCNFCRSAARGFACQSFRSECLGFRVALAPSH